MQSLNKTSLNCILFFFLRLSMAESFASVQMIIVQKMTVMEAYAMKTKAKGIAIVENVLVCMDLRGKLVIVPLET